MTKEDLERRLESAEKQMSGLQDEIQNLKARLAEVQEPEIPEYPFVAERQKYWFVEEEDFKLNYGISIGGLSKDYNCFHTESYAQEFARKCKLIAMMMHCKWYICPDYTQDFTDLNAKKWTVVYDAATEEYETDYNWHHVLNTVYFDTEENAQKCADWLNAHKEMIENDS